MKDTIKEKTKEEDQKTFEECRTLIKRVIEYQHNKVMHRQKQKFEHLQQKKSGHSNEGQHISTDNTTMDTKKWVKNLSNTPLTVEQERLLSHGPKFVIKPRRPPVREYVAAMEQACSRLNLGEADELQVEVKKTLTKAQNKTKTTSNITNDEFKALKELKDDKSRIILAADKGVALVIWRRMITSRKQKNY